jgi:hypothetical protein
MKYGINTANYMKSRYNTGRMIVELSKKTEERAFEWQVDRRNMSSYGTIANMHNAAPIKA